MMSLVVHELADIAQHRRRLQPIQILRRQFMHLLQIAKELRRMEANRLGLLRIDPVTPG